MTDTSTIARGRSIANKLGAALDSDGHDAADRVRGELNAEDRAALSAFRDDQLARIIGSIEDSPTGAAIRFEEGKRAYAALVAEQIASSIKGNGK